MRVLFLKCGDFINIYMEIALKEAKKALKKGDVPIGAVIVKNGRIISKSHNTKEKKQIAVNHAEILAIKKACKKLNSWHLDECEMYITMEPCMMCVGAITQSRIKKIYYSTENKNFGSSKFLGKNVIIESGMKKEISSKMITDFFKNKR